MLTTARARTTMMVGLGIASALIASACGSSSSPAAAGSSTAAGGGLNLAAANATLATVTGHPSPFPTLTHLSKPIAPGTKFMYLQCGTPVCALEGQLIQPAAKELGISITTVLEGSTATSAQAAVATVLAAKPAGAILTAVDPQFFGGQLPKITAAGIKLVSLAVVDGDKYGIPVNLSTNAFGGWGSYMAAWVISTEQTKANTVFFGTPELSFTPPLQAGVTSTFKQDCPSCKVAYSSLPLASIGTTAPSMVVSYLRAHPSVNTVMFASMESATGLASALRNAGLHPVTIGFAPTPSNLQDVKDGGLTAALGVDLNMATWETVDALARQIDGQPISEQEGTGGAVQILTQKDITFDPKLGWPGYPDVAQRFGKVWN